MKNSSLSLQKLDARIRHADPQEYDMLIALLASDRRDGARARLEKLLRKKDAYTKEKKRIEAMHLYETSLYRAGYERVAGMDEVGRGCVFGPVVSACVILPPGSRLLYVNDSKKLSAQKREMLYDQICQEALAIGIGVVDAAVIDEINIFNATKLSMQKALQQISPPPDMLLVDAMHVETDIEQRSFIRGDANHYCIAAASIVAKVHRDHMMQKLSAEYACYDIAQNKGYGTAAHLQAIQRYGISDLHRKSFLQAYSSASSPTAIGKAYEQQAKAYLAQIGMPCLECNYRCKGGEIDLICKESDTDTLVFVEVRYRGKGSYDSALDSIRTKKIQHVRYAAQQYLAQNALDEMPVRFDVVVYDAHDDTFHHIKDAF